MASNMTTTEKLKHPITAVKQMLHKDNTTNDTTNTKLSNETGTTYTNPTNVVNEEQLPNQLGGTPTLGTTAGTGARPVYSETGTGHHHTGLTGAGVGAGAGAVGATGLAGYEAEKHLGHHGQHTGTHLGQGSTTTGVTGTGVGHHTGTRIGEGVAGAGAVGVAGYEAEKHLGHHGQHTGTGLTGTGNTGLGHHGQHTGTHIGEGVAGAGALGTAGYEAEKHLGHHGQHTGHQGHHTGAHIGEGVAGAGALGVAGYEAEKHLGHHGQHTGTGYTTTGTGLTGTGTGYNTTGTGYTTAGPGYTTTAPGYTTTGTGYTGTGVGHHGHHTGTHIGEGVVGAGAVGTGAYEAEKHLGHHNRHEGDTRLLSNDPGLPGTTGVRGEEYTPNMPRPQNVGLNVIGFNTPMNTSDYRSYDKQPAQGSVTRSDLADQGLNEERIEKTSLPANPLMSALTGGKIPPSIHEGAKQAGLYGGDATGTTTGTGIRDTTRTGINDTVNTGRTGAYDTTRRDVV